MPELPEVRVVSKFLNSTVKGLTIKNIEIRYDKMMTKEMKEKLIGQKINKINTHGKYIIFDLTDYDLISHLRMEGKYFIRSTKTYNKHDHIIFHLNDKILVYNDVRKFGTFDLREKHLTYKTKPLNKLADEPFVIDVNVFYEKIKKSSAPLKTLLLNQEIIAGIGNIYADEILFLSKLHPLKKGKETSLKESHAIIQNSIDVLSRAILKGGTTIYSFKSDGDVGYFAQELLVHRRYNEECKICSNLIEKEKIGGRTTYYCNVCQRKWTMKKIGITGSLGTGKSQASNFFKKQGHLVISADLINKELLEEKEVIVNINKILFNIESSTLDKEKVRNLIFSNKNKKKELELYLHPLIYAKIKEILSSSKEEIVFLEIPLLYETNFIDLTDYVIVIYADKEVQIKRIKQRDNISKTEAIKRIKSQMPLKEKLLKADYVINNSNTQKETEKQLKTWYDNYLRRL